MFLLHPSPAESGFSSPGICTLSPHPFVGEKRLPFKLSQNLIGTGRDIMIFNRAESFSRGMSDVF